MRGLEEEFEAVNPPLSMNNFSLMEVALAYSGAPETMAETMAPAWNDWDLSGGAIYWHGGCDFLSPYLCHLYICTALVCGA